MSTSNYQTAVSKANTEGYLLLDIKLYVDDGTLQNLYLANKYLTVDGVGYEGIVKTFGNMDIQIPNEGISATNDYSITLLNTRLNFMQTDTRISDLLNNHWFAGCECKIYQWFDELTSKDDAELLFKGIAKQPVFDRNEIKFDIVENDNISINLPFDIVTLNDFSEAPEESIGNPLPIVFGDDWDWTDRLSEKACVSPCIEVNNELKTFYISGHQINQVNLGTGGHDLLVYLENINRYGYINAPSHSYINNTNGAKVTMGADVAYAIYIHPKLKGSQYSSAVTDYSNILDNDISTVIQLQAGETFYLQLDGLPDGVLEHNITSSIICTIEVNAVTGSSPYGILRYYNAGWTAGGTKFSTGANITGAWSLTYNIRANRDRKGIRSDNTDQNDRWTMEDLKSLEYGITVNAGCTIDISKMWIYLGRIPLVYAKSFSGAIGRPPSPDLIKNQSLISLGAQVISKKINIISNIFIDLNDGGKEFDDWIDEQGRNNGRNSGDCIVRPPYIIESLLRDFMGFSDDEIHHQSFDVHGNTTDGTLKDWSFAGGIYNVKNSREILDNLLMQCKSQLYINPAGRASLIVNDTIDYTRHNITGDNLLSNHSFETAGGGSGDGSGDVFGTWTEGNNNNTTRRIYRDGTYKSDSSYSARFNANGNDNTYFQLNQRGFSVTADTPHRLTFDYYYRTGTSLNFKFYIFDYDNVSYLIPIYTINSLNSDFETITIDFIPPANSSDCSIVFDIYETNANVYIDNVKLYEVKQYYSFDKDTNFKNLKVYRTPYEQLVNEVFINFWLDRGSGNFGKCSFVSSKKEFSGTYLANNMNATEWLMDVKDGTKFSANDIIMADKEINLVTSIAGNTLVLQNAGGSRVSYRNSDSIAHTLGIAIYIITESSDDGTGSQDDTTREAEASESIWKYNIDNKLEIDADWIVSTVTATALRDYYFDWYSVPHWNIEFDCFLETSDIQIGSIIRLDNSVMDSDLLCGGESWSGKDFRIKKIQRTGNTDYHIKAEEI